MVSCLIFKSLSHVEFIFVCGVRECSNFIDLHEAVQLSQHHLLKRPFSTVYSCLFCQRLIDSRCVGVSLGSVFCSIDSCLFLCHYHAVLMTAALSYGEESFREG